MAYREHITGGGCLISKRGTKIRPTEEEEEGLEGPPFFAASSVKARAQYYVEKSKNLV